MKNALFRFIGLLVTVSCIFAEEKSDLIINGSDWFDTEGRKISAHEGELARFGDYFTGMAAVTKIIHKASSV